MAIWREVAVMGRWGCNMTLFFREVQPVYCAKFMLTVAYNDNPILNNIYTRYIIVDNLCLLQHINGTQLKYVYH